jgi:hypothetical protein
MSDEKTEGGPVVERIERPAPAEQFGAFLMEAMNNPAIPADKLLALGQLRREVLADQARETFQEHFAKFSAELPQVERDGTVELVKDGVNKGRYPFTTIEAMDKILRPRLAEHGFSISFSSRDDKDTVTITGTLAGWGWKETSTYTLPPDVGPGRNAIQARGSSRRYAKRYIIDDLCNVVRKGKDDDGRGAMEALIDATQIAALTKLIKETKTDEASFLKMLVTGVDALGDIRQRDYPRLLLALRDKKAKQAVRK